MKTRNYGWVFGLLVLVCAGACSDTKSTPKVDKDAAASSDGAVATGDAGTDAGGQAVGVAKCDVVVSDKDCDKTLRPFVFVHGTYGSGDNFAHVASLLTSNGYCPERIVGVEYNSLGGSPGTDGNIDGVINKVLKDNPTFTQVDLAGHSQGTSHCGTYLGVAANAKKVAHYVNFSGTPAVGDVDTLSLSSMHDLGMAPHHATGNKVKTVTFMDEDHFAVAASQRSFIEVYKYLNAGKAPKYTEIQCGDDMVTVEGISETFADNSPVTGKVEIREAGAARAAGKPAMTAMSDSKGHFGPVTLKRGIPYEMKGFDAAGKVVGYQYFTPFQRSNRLVRMLSPSKLSFVAMSSTDHVVRGPNHAALIVRWSGGAFRQDLGASLKIDGTESLTSENSGDKALAVQNLNGGVVALFMYDANTNSKSDYGLAFSAPFLSFTDVYIDAKKPKLVELSFTAGSEETAIKDQTVSFSNWPSTDALVSVMFQ